ncbi:unnamed protein product [marine sediment metagenome]|uniref:Uncharacterized protein n=1 Tax=marine sediment metagenome TaxID=412755 RepID=X1C7S1_9ZZZZ
MTKNERLQLLSELRAIQLEYPHVDVSIEWATATGRTPQDRVNEIERMLNADSVGSRVTRADLEE